MVRVSPASLCATGPISPAAFGLHRGHVRSFGSSAKEGTLALTPLIYWAGLHSRGLNYVQHSMDPGEKGWTRLHPGPSTFFEDSQTEKRGYGANLPPTNQQNGLGPKKQGGALHQSWGVGKEEGREGGHS